MKDDKPMRERIGRRLSSAEHRQASPHTRFKKNEQNGVVDGDTDGKTPHAAIRVTMKW